MIDGNRKVCLEVSKYLSTPRYKKTYTSRLRGGGTFILKEVCFSIMMASNKDLLTDIYDPRAVFGGLLGRTFLILPDEFRPANSLFNIGDREEQYIQLIQYLKEIEKLRGPFTFTEEAQTEFDSWYAPFRESYKNRQDRSGIAGRIHFRHGRRAVGERATAVYGRLGGR